MDAALMVFIRRPQKGKVKTRLAAAIGDDAALEVYKQLLQHTLQVTASLLVHKYVFYADIIAEEDDWQQAGFVPLVQTDGDLGQRMHTAFATLFDKAHAPVVIIGSDCIELDTNILLDAFAVLNEADVVIGPANDGGYYLLGLHQAPPLLFENMPWSTEVVLTQTLERIQLLNLKLHVLPELIDIDTSEDLQAARQRGLLRDLI